MTALLIVTACAPVKGDTEGETSTGTTADEATGSAGSTTTGGIVTATGVEPETSSTSTGDDPTAGTTADPTEATSDTNGDCIEDVTPLALDVVTPLGFSAEEALAGQVGARGGMLTWSPDGFVHPDLKGAMWTTSLGIDYAGGAIEYIEASPGMGGGEDGPAVECASRLEITVILTINSENGELTEIREVVVRVFEVGTIEVPNIPLLPLTGSLTPEQVIEAPMTLDSLDVYASLTPVDGSGGLNGEVSDPNLGSVGYGTLASLMVLAPE